MTKTLQEIADSVGTEELSYAIQNGYIIPEDFEEEDLQLACSEVREGLYALDRALEDYLP